MDIGIEREVFHDGQVFIQAEFLWHIADTVLNGLGRLLYIVSTDGETAGIGLQ